MSLTRRVLLRHLACGLGAASSNGWLPLLASPPSESGGWTPEWDAALLHSEIERLGRAFDEKEQMLSTRRGPDYNYQTNLRSTTAHMTRESLEYASLLLYLDDAAATKRAVAILERVLPLQVQDPASPYFGLWSWYLEEPVEKMHSADFNWADFIGAILLNVLFEHEKRIPAALVAAVRGAVQRACASIRKRDVTLYYTNIAFQGTYVTLAAAELLEDADLLGYARQRFRRLNAIVEGSGSFAEYNSPTYMAVTLENLSRMLMYVHDAESRALAEKLNALAWKHIAEHWHAPTKQLAGPMSRAYSNDIGSPMWIQKATGNRVRFVTIEELAKHAPGGEISIPIVDFHCPRELLGLFEATPRHQVREVFIAGSVLVDNLDVSERAKPVAPVEGTTLLTPKFALGSANRSDFWIQRRPLIAYWGDASRPPRCLQLRVIKDEYDFASGLFYSAQNEGSVLGSVRFRSDGGDKHPSLDRIVDETFSLSRMRVELLLQQWNASNRFLVDGEPLAQFPATARSTSRIAMDAGGVKILFRVRSAHFLEAAKELRIEQKDGALAISVELMQSDAPRVVHWSELSDAGCDFALWMDDSPRQLEDVDKAFAAAKFSESGQGGVRSVHWASTDGALEVQSATNVLPVVRMDEAYEARIGGKAYPYRTLEQAPIRY